MHDLKHYCLKQIGVDVWKERHPHKNPFTLNDLALNVSSCTLCDLAHHRTQTVFGVGNPKASLMIIGEAPGYYEDKQGEPFVGRAGKLLNAMLNSIALKREDVFIANIIKCRPPENRDPQKSEVAACTPYLQQQINLIRPKFLLAVGKVSGNYLLNTDANLKSMRQKIHVYGETQTPLIITYHPAYLLRNPKDKGKAYMDLLMLQQQLRGN